MPNGEEKPRPRPAPEGPLETTDPFEVIFVLSLITLLGGAILERIIAFSRSGDSLQAFRNFVSAVWPFSLFISTLFIAGIAYSLRKLTKLNRELFLKFPSAKKALPAKPSAEEIVNKRWQEVLNHLESSNMSDWKLAILEADIMLEEMVDKIGYKGESLGDKLKSVERSDFNTVDLAWQAHKIRNAIAHEGAGFHITQEEARRAISLYRKVFEEFKYI